MAAIDTLVDTFDSLNTTRWPNRYSESGATPTVTGGRLRVLCRTPSNYTGASSASTYTLNGSSVYAEVPVVPAYTPTADEAYCCLAVRSNTDGTYVEALYDAADNAMHFHTVSGDYEWDAGDVVVPYDATAHRWWKIECLASGTDRLRFYTSPDGWTWTEQRRMTAPSWMTTGTVSNQLRVNFESSRDVGTNDYAEYDNLNTAPVVAPTVSAGADAEIDLGDTFTRTGTETAGAPATSRTWKIQSGPAGVGNTLSTAAALSWTPTVPGTYVLRYTATNSAGSGSDDVTVEVVAPGAGIWTGTDWAPASMSLWTGSAWVPASVTALS